MDAKRKRLFHRIAACCMSLVLTASLTACGSSDRKIAGVVAGMDLKVAVIGQSEGIQFWDYVRDGAVQAGEEFGYNVNYVNASAITDVEGQIQLVRDAINDGVNAIVVAPNDQDALNDVLRDALDAGIHVLTIDADVTFGGRESYIGTQNFAGGAMAARQAAQFLTTEKDKAAIIGHSDKASSAQERVEGFRTVLTTIINQMNAAKLQAQADMAAAHGANTQTDEGNADENQNAGAPEGAGAEQGGAPEGAGAQQGGAPAGAGAQQGGAPSASKDIPQLNPIASLQYCDGDADIAKQQARELLSENENIKVIYTTNERSTIGVCEAVEELGLSGQVQVIGFNSNSSEINYIKSGTLTGTIIQNPYNMGYLGVFYAGKLAAGESVSKAVDTGVTYVNAENLNNDEIQLMLDPVNYLKGASDNG